MELSRKASLINESVTLEITAKAKALKEAGVDVVSFGVGEPDFNTPNNIIESAITAMKEGKTKYTPTAGILELRQSVCKKLEEDNGLVYKPSQIVISTGAKQSLTNTFMAILNPGDEVIISIPYWVSYPELIKLFDGVPVLVETSEANSFKLTVEDLEKSYTSKTKAILLNSPNNPTGAVYTKDELVAIAEFAKEKDILIISDEIYEKLVYGDVEHVSIASLSEDAYNRTIVINGLSKSSAMTGWRLGYSACSEEITKLMVSVQSHMTSNACSITQYAALEALNGPKEDLENMVQEFKKRRNYMINKLTKIPGISIIRPKGAFYVMINVSSYLNTVYNGTKITNSVEFAKCLLEDEKVAVIPGSAFGLDNYIRLSYATSMDVIEKGIDRIELFLSKIK
ncbi:MAG: pyridoxal phosphate-dependent aminotransferase [Clostridium sp.]